MIEAMKYSNALATLYVFAVLATGCRFSSSGTEMFLGDAAQSDASPHSNAGAGADAGTAGAPSAMSGANGAAGATGTSTATPTSSDDAGTSAVDSGTDSAADADTATAPSAAGSTATPHAGASAPVAGSSAPTDAGTPATGDLGELPTDPDEAFACAAALTLCLIDPVNYTECVRTTAGPCGLPDGGLTIPSAECSQKLSECVQQHPDRAQECNAMLATCM